MSVLWVWVGRVVRRAAAYVVGVETGGANAWYRECSVAVRGWKEAYEDCDACRVTFKFGVG